MTEIQNGIVTRVKTEQIEIKKAASSELRVITDKLSELNKKLERNLKNITRDEVLEAREEFNSKYNNFFKKEAE